METLLRLKAWQIFMLTFGIIVIAASAMMVLGLRDLMDLTLVTRITALIIVVGLNIANAWLYMVAITFHKKLPPHVDININAFKICFWYIVIYQVMSLLLLQELTVGGPLDTLLTIVSYICSICVFYIAAKILQSAERQKNLTFGDVAGDFFAFLFYPVGVWFLQPRINRLFDNELASIDPDAPLDQGVR